MGRELNDGVGDLEVVPARPEDATVVAEILEDARRWLAGRGIAQWSVPFGDGWIAEKIAAGEFHVARIDDAPVATMRLLWADPLFWGGREQGDAVYIHTMAVRRDRAGRGLGARLLRWAADQGRMQGRRFLRLDCEVSNAALTAYYLQQGFTEHGRVEIGGATMRLLETSIGA